MEVSEALCPKTGDWELQSRLPSSTFCFFLGKNNFQENILLITFIIELNELTLKFHIGGKSIDVQLRVENL